VSDLNTTLSALEAASDPFRPSAPRLVQGSDGTMRENPHANGAGATTFAGDPDADVDGLFGTSPAYVKIKKEKPVHRLMLWAALNGHRPEEIAVMFRTTKQTVYNVQKQPWFQEAFCRISSEQGKDSVEKFLEGQILPTLQKLVDLRDGGENVPAAVQKSACDAILDRIRGKPTVHVKSESTGSLDVVVHDAARLQEEYTRNQEILRSRGIRTGEN
jgi:hypothetical protein